ncbi:MAG: tail fiber domain-containing protein [Microcystis aeruginosa F13-15]|jgi:hypothetical protein|nr:tail fiber domain-containing protein [Microcystis aeruginosa F13-15]
MPLADTLNRNPGDILKSDDWNVIIKEIDRLETAKINRDGADTLKGPLTIAEALNANSNVTIKGNLSIVVPQPQEPSGQILVLGPTNASNLRLGYHQDYSWIQSHGSKPLLINRLGNNIGIGSTINPVASLDIASASRTGTHPTAVKSLYITGDFNADNDGVEFRHSNGTQGIGFGFNTIYAAGSAANQDLGLKPKGTGEVKVAGNLSVSGIVKAQALTVSSNLSVTGSVSFGSQVRQMLNLWSTNYGIGVQNWTQYFRSDGNFAWYKAGSHNDAELNAGGGTSLMTLDSNGVLSVSGIVKIGSLQLGGFTSEDKQEWPIVVWYRNTDQNWDEGLIKLPASQGVFQKAGFGIHLHKNRQFGFWSTGPIQLFAVEGDTGNTYIRGNLKVNGAITPSVGNSENNGIMFPKDPGRGAGDAAWIRYYVRGGEATTFEIGTSNDYNDHIALMPNAGNVGIGTSTPNDKLDVAGSLRILTDSNPIRFTSKWSGFPDAVTVTNQAEISNDTGDYKTLMIVGNRSANLGRRVSIWDRLEVNGALTYWSVAQVSSRKLKKNILDISAEEAVESLAKLNPVKYNLKADKDNNLHLGFIAEDVPDLVASHDRQTISNDHIVALLTKVIKEQEKRLLELVEKVEILEKKS